MKRFLVILLFVIFYAFYLLLTKFLFGSDNLMPIKGMLLNKYSYVKIDSTDQKEHIKYAYLTFSLKGDKRMYTIKANINTVYQGFNVFGGVSLSLKNNTDLVVWIQKGDFEKINPRVYKISSDGENIYEYIHKPGNNTGLFLSIAGLSLCFLIILFIYSDWPNTS